MYACLSERECVCVVFIDYTHNWIYVLQRSKLCGNAHRMPRISAPNEHQAYVLTVATAPVTSASSAAGIASGYAWAACSVRLVCETI